MNNDKLLEKALSTINRLNGKIKALSAQNAKRQNINKRENEEIAIIGMSYRFPQAPNLKLFWERPHSQFDGVGCYPASRLSLLGINENVSRPVASVAHISFSKYFGYSSP